MITQRIADVLHGQGYVGEREDAEMIADVLVTELGLRELPTSGYLDPLGFLHSYAPGETYGDYVQYISKWHPA